MALKYADIVTLNEELKNKPSPVALVMGGTSGIGLAIVKAIYKRFTAPRIYFVGRNQTAATQIIEEASKINPSAKLTFIQYDIYLLTNVVKFSRDFINAELAIDGINSEADIKLNLLVTTTGTFNTSNTPTSENLQPELVSRHYARALSANLLLPYLQNASTTPIGARVFSVFAAGQEKPLNTDSVNLRAIPNPNFFTTTIWHATTLQSLFTEEASLRYPEISFTHIYPGVVAGGLHREMPWWGKFLFKILSPIMNLFATSEAEIGDRCLYMMTDESMRSGAHLRHADGSKNADWREAGGWNQWKTKEEWDKKRKEWRDLEWKDFNETVGEILGEDLRKW